jgi:hypothetical protein
MAIDFIAGITTFFILAAITLICAYSDAYHSRRRRRRSFVQDPNKMADANVHLHTRL